MPQKEGAIGIEIRLRREFKEDFRKVETLTREAFWNVYHPGCSEHFLVHEIRLTEAFIPELDIVAERDKQLVGHIIYTRSKVITTPHCSFETITFGPISVLPAYQRQGIGSALIRHTLSIAKQMSFRAIIIFGDPSYYRRFGFRSASDFGITTADGQSFDAFMVLELYEGSMKGISGVFQHDPVFNVDPEKVAAFDNTFPVKEKRPGETLVGLPGGPSQSAR